MKFKELIVEFVETILTSFIVILAIYIFVAAIEVVSGSSMDPTFHTGQRILVEKITKHFKPIQRGEVVVLYPPSGERKHFIKRIVGMPGDVIKIINCNIEISRDGEQFLLREYYIDSEVCTRAMLGYMRDGRSLKLADDEYLVFGDNREFSVDSRAFGPIKLGNIVGRVVFRFWPLNTAGFIK